MIGGINTLLRRRAETLERLNALGPLVPDDMSLPEFALRVILSHPDVTTVIPGMRKAIMFAITRCKRRPRPTVGSHG